MYVCMYVYIYIYIHIHTYVEPVALRVERHDVLVHGAELLLGGGLQQRSAINSIIHSNIIINTNSKHSNYILRAPSRWSPLG